jgi:ATP-dependent helicase HrpB
LTVSGVLKAIEHLFDPEPAEAALTRLKLLRVVSADIGGADLGRLIEKTFEGLTDLSDLTPEGLARRILETQTPEIQRRIDAQLPTHVLLKGRRVPIHYRWDQKPWIESRLQDFFGLREGPSLLGGKIPLTLHLLAPSRRPVQVTQDLASFWKNAYPQIRKELSRKYPKHKWPAPPS